MLKSIGKTIIINIIILIVFICLGELIFREIYHEFNNNVHHRRMTFGKKFSETKFHGINTRVPYEGCTIDINENVPIMLIIGDSITGGYGSSYEDMYQHKLERLLNIDSKIQIISLSGYGDGLYDSAERLDALLTKCGDKLKIKYIMYQFNFNDITPFNRSALKKGDHLEGFEHTKLFRKFAKLRYEYLNKSTLLTVMLYYASVIKRRGSGTCEERGYDALAQYTWTFGCRPFKGRSEELWRQFEIDLTKVIKLSDRLSVKFVIFISPISYDIDVNGVHRYYNPFNLDFSCATIDPRERLISMARKLNIDVIDPKDYVKIHFENRVKEGNFEPFFFPADSNHFTPVAAGYISEYLYQYFHNLKN